MCCLADYKHKTGQAGSDSSMADSSVSAAATSQTAHWGQMSLDGTYSSLTHVGQAKFTVLYWLSQNT